MDAVTPIVTPRCVGPVDLLHKLIVWRIVDAKGEAMRLVVTSLVGLLCAGPSRIRCVTMGKVSGEFRLLSDCAFQLPE